MGEGMLEKIISEGFLVGAANVVLGIVTVACFLVIAGAFIRDLCDRRIKVVHGGGGCGQRDSKARPVVVGCSGANVELRRHIAGCEKSDLFVSEEGIIGREVKPDKKHTRPFLPT